MAATGVLPFRMSPPSADLAQDASPASSHRAFKISHPEFKISRLNLKINLQFQDLFKISRLNLKLNLKF